MPSAPVWAVQFLSSSLRVIGLAISFLEVMEVSHRLVEKLTQSSPAVNGVGQEWEVYF